MWFSTANTINTHLTTILCILPNLLVIYLTLTTTTTEIRRYRWMLAAQSLIEILICATLSLIVTAIYEANGELYIIEMGIFAASHKAISSALYMLYAFLLISNIILLQVIFTFRYSLICRYVFSRSFNFVYASMNLLHFSHICDSWNFETANVLTHIHRIKLIRFEHFDFQRRGVSFARIAGVVVASCVVTATYVIIIFTAIKIWIVQTHINASEKTRRLRKQLVVVMLLQVLFNASEFPYF
uniref:G-protein coupled receptors family 1 profile domain-containing protein n=1 Tax=Parascaris equorum TaxID=6256 RepID=A0A914S7S4_PAREQ